MYQGQPPFRRHAPPFLEHYPPGAAPMYPAGAFPPSHQQMSVPMTPLDFAYSQSMLPANLLGTPSPYVNHPTFLSSQQSQFFNQPSPASPRGPGSVSSFQLPRAHSSSMLFSNASQIQLQQQYQLQQQQQQQQQQNFRPTPGSLDHLSFSRTVVLSGLSARHDLRGILDQIDHGPIESVELRTAENSGSVSGLVSCHISFVNTHVSHHFYSAYAKDSQMLKDLKDRLGEENNFEILVPSLQESNRTPGGKRSATPHAAPSDQDVIKVKTLNYIVEFNATRALVVSFRILDSDLVPLMEKAFRVRCAKFGNVEDFVVTEDDESGELEFLVHFTTIDAAIESYEYYSARLPTNEPDAAPADDARDDLVQLTCTFVAFQPDRCDRTPLLHGRNSLAETGSLESTSPVPSEQAVPQLMHRRGSPTHSISQESSRVSDMRSGLKALDISAEGKYSSQELVASDTRATSEQSADHVEGKTLFAAATSNFADPAEMSFGPAGSGPPSPSPAPSEYFIDHSFNSGYSSFTADPYLQSHLNLSGLLHSSRSESYSSLPQAQLNSESLNSGNRTIYLGNLHPKTTVEEIANNVRAGGLVEFFRHYPGRRTCFVTFIDPAIALKFYLSHQVLHQLVIRDCEVTVNWGKTHSGSLPQNIAYSVTAGASRNVYIGLRLNKSGPANLKVPNEKTLRRDFSRFGAMEQINHVHKKDCGFMNFLDIADAIKVVECFDARDEKRIMHIVGDTGQFYEKYRHFKISYGKDRCGNPLKFTYVKRKSSVGREADASVADDPAKNHANPKAINAIDEEAANVFGISTNQTCGADNTISSDLHGESTTIEEGDSVSEVLEISVGNILEKSKNGQSQVGGNSSKARDEAAPRAAEGKASSARTSTTNALENLAEEINEEIEGDEDEDDDISIIIGSQDEVKPRTRNYKKVMRKSQKIYHRDYELSQLLNTSLSTLGDATMAQRLYGHGYDQGLPAARVATSPAFPRQQPQLSTLQYPRRYSRDASVGPPPFFHSNGSFGPHSPLASGSSVMSEYLARSQHDNYLYAVSLVNGDMPADGMRETGYPRRRSFRK